MKKRLLGFSLLVGLFFAGNAGVTAQQLCDGPFPAPGSGPTTGTGSSGGGSGSGGSGNGGSGISLSFGKG